MARLQQQVVHLAETVEERTKDKTFECKITITMNVDLAFALANFILDSKDCPNRALLALAHTITG